MTLLATPRDWWNVLDAEFNFTLDAAADDENFMCSPYITEEQNALEQDWTGRVWCSPPWYEPTLLLWVRKGYLEARKNDCTVVMLLPIRPMKDWWHDYVLMSAQIRFIRGALDFTPINLNRRGIPVLVEPHCLVVFAGYAADQVHSWSREFPIASSYPSRVIKGEG